jgi:transposase
MRRPTPSAGSGRTIPVNKGLEAQEKVGHELREALAPVLEVILGLTERIRAYDREIRRRCKLRYPETDHLSRVPGVGALTALAFVLCIECAEPTSRRRSAAS